MGLAHPLFCCLPCLSFYLALESQLVLVQLTAIHHPPVMDRVNRDWFTLLNRDSWPAYEWVCPRDRHMHGYIPVAGIWTGTSPWPAYARVRPRDRHMHGHVEHMSCTRDSCRVSSEVEWFISSLWEWSRFIPLRYQGTPIRMCHNSILHYLLTILLIFDLDKTL